MSLTLFSTSTEDKDTKEVIMTDFDGDGDIDYVAGNNDVGDVFKFDVYLNNGSASFSTSTFGTSVNFSTGTAADIDGDGDADIISANDTELYKYVNNGSGVFTRYTIATGLAQSIQNIVTADFDNDGDIDFIGGASSNSVASALYINDGHGTFTAAASSLPTFADLCVADFNSDSYVDLALNKGDNTMRVFRNSGTGAFVQLSSVAHALMSMPIACGDIDGDGDIDVVGTDSTSIVPYINNGAGTLAVGTTTATSITTPQDIDLGDLDNDGALDAIVSGDNSVGTSGAEIFINNGSAVFTSQGSPPNNNDGTTSVAIGDLDNDGDLDYIRGNFDASGAGGGEQNRVYTNDQAATLANTAPIAVSSSTMTGMLVYPYRGGNTFTTENISNFIDWTNPSNAATSNDTNALAQLIGDESSYYLKATNFGFNIPSSATILGVKAEVERRFDQAGGGACQIYDNAVRLIKGGTIQSTDKSNVSTWPSSDAYQTYGGATDLWGTTWTPAEINASDFGFTISAIGLYTLFFTQICNVQIDHIRITVYYNMRDIRLSWGSGSDTETTTRLLQYQLKLGTGSNANNIVSGVTASPNWVNRLMPNGQSRTYLIKNIPCSTGVTYYWSVGTVDTGFKNTASTEQTFTLDSSCTFTGNVGGGGSSGGSSGGASGGGGVPIHFFQLNRPSAGGVPAEGALTVTAFKDINADGSRQDKEPTGFRGLAVTASGSSAEGQPQRKTLVLNKDGTASFSLPPSDRRGYFILFDTGSTAIQGYTLTKKPSASGTVLRSEDVINIDLGFKRSNLLRYAPCLTIATTGNRESSEAHTFLSRLVNPFGRRMMQGISFDESLVSRQTYFDLLRRTQCITLASDETALKEKIRMKKTSSLIDLPFEIRQLPSVLAYTLLTEGISLARITPKGPAADFSSRISRREAIRTVFEALDVPPDAVLSTGTLPTDLSSDDPLVPAFLTLQSLGILPDSFLPILGSSQGINLDEATLLLARAAFRGGRIFLTQTTFDESSQLKNAAPTITATFLSILPPLSIPSCLQKYPDRPKDLAFVDVLPGDQNENDLREILSRGITNEKGKILWLLPATKRPTEYGVAKGSTRLSIDEIPTTLETLRDLLVLTCLPYDYNEPDSGDSRISRDNISNLPRDKSFVSRVFYRAQDSIRLFNLSLFSYAQNILRLPTRSPADPLSIGEASSILSSALLHMTVSQEILTPQEAENLAEPLTSAIAQQLLGTNIDWRSEAILKNTPFTREMLISFLATVLQNRTSVSSATSSNPVSLGDLWWERVQ